MSRQKSRPTITNDSCVVAIKDQVSCALEDDKVVLNTSSGVYFGLDSVGARVWDLIQEPKVVDNLRQTLMAEYDVDADRCGHDLLALLVNMAEHGLIEIASGSNS